MIKKTRIQHKALISVRLDHREPPADDASLVGEISSEIQNNFDEFPEHKTVGDEIPLKIDLTFRLTHQDIDYDLFEFDVAIVAIFEVLEDFSITESFAETAKLEVMPFVYDDIRQIMSFLANQTPYRGLSLPPDFREILNQ